MLQLRNQEMYNQSKESNRKCYIFERERAQLKFDIDSYRSENTKLKKDLEKYNKENQNI